MGATEIFFDGDAPKHYDRYLGPILFHSYADDLADRLLLRGSLKDVLELACGTGILTRRLLDRLSPMARLIASDLSLPMMVYAKERIGSSERVEWRQADATSLPFPDAAFDAVICQFGVMFFPDKLTAMKEVRRVLRPGRSFLFNVWGSLEDNVLPRIAYQAVRERVSDSPPEFMNIPFGYYQPEIIRAVLHQAGFRDVEISNVETKGNGFYARDFTTGILKGSPLESKLQDRGVDLRELIDTVVSHISQECGDPIRDVRMLALAVTAKAGE